jgi:hypothetical protein
LGDDFIAVHCAARAAFTSATESRAVAEQPQHPHLNHLRILDHILSAPPTATMDFRDLDHMGDTDESILDEPYRPFYNIFASRPVLVKQ